MSRCKNCYNESFGKPYCYDCYKKYQSAIDNHLYGAENCSELNLPTKNPRSIFASYQSNRRQTCDNGNKVRSKSEQIISDFLTKKDIAHSYEKALKIDDISKQYIFPDFYIPVLIKSNGKIIENVYLEHLGGPGTKNLDKINQYTDSLNFKLRYYEAMKLTVLCTTEEDINDINKSLSEKLDLIKEHKINY